MPDNRLPTNQSLIDLKDSIDLLTANINRTASNIPYDSNLTIKAAIDGKVSKSGDTMSGQLLIDEGTTNSRIFLGNDSNNNARGLIRFYGLNGKFANLYPSSLTDNRNAELPDKSGTIALTSDFDAKVLSFYSGDSSVSVSTTPVTIGGGAQSVTLKKGKYLVFGAINATWTNGAYQFGLFANIGNNSVQGGSYAREQTNSPCLLSAIVDVPSDGAYNVYASCKTTNAQKTVTLPAYQNMYLTMIRVST